MVYHMFIMENPIKTDDLGGKKPIFGNTHLIDGDGIFVWHAVSNESLFRLEVFIVIKLTSWESKVPPPRPHLPPINKALLGDY